MTILKYKCKIISIRYLWFKPIKSHVFNLDDIPLGQGRTRSMEISHISMFDIKTTCLKNKYKKKSELNTLLSIIPLKSI